MQDWIALLLVSGLMGLDRILLGIVMKFKRAVLPAADQATNAGVISKDCRIVSMGLEVHGMEPIPSSLSRVVTCFNAANHKHWMRAGRIVLFKMRHNLCMRGVSAANGYWSFDRVLRL